MSKPTTDDANLMIQLMRWGAAENLQDARNWIWSEYGYASKVCGWFESVGTLYKQGLLNSELLFDWLTIKLPWSRLSGFAIGVRNSAGEPRLYENFEAMAKEESMK